jgi:hypothetical protein
MAGGVMEDGGGMESEDRRVEMDEIVVETDDSLERRDCTSISSIIVRFRFRDTAGPVGFRVSMARDAAAAFLLDVGCSLFVRV